MRIFYFKVVMAITSALFFLGNTGAGAQELYLPLSADEVFYQKTNLFHYKDMPKTDDKMKPGVMTVMKPSGAALGMVDFYAKFKAIYTYGENNNLTRLVGYDVDPGNGRFRLMDKLDFTYDSKNRVTSVMSYQYDQEKDSWLYVDSAIVKYSDKGEYDPVLVDYKSYDRESGKWWDLLYDNRAIESEFDKEGRVTKITRWSDYTRDNSDMLCCRFEYEEGKENPVRMELVQNSFEGESVFYFYDVVWNKCNNVFLRLNQDVADLFEGDPENQLASYKMASEKGGDPICTLENTYKNDSLVRHYSKMMDDYVLIEDEYGNDDKGRYRRRLYESGTADENNKRTPSEGQLCLFRFDANGEVNEITVSNPANKNEAAKVYGFELKYYANELLTSRTMFEYENNRTEKNYIWKQEFGGYKKPVPSGIAEVKDSRDVTVSYRSGVIFVTDAEGAPYSIVSIEGAACMSGRVNGGRISTDALAPGMYIAKVNGTAVKFVVR